MSEFRMFTNRKLGLRLESAIFSFLSIFVRILCELCDRYAAKVIIVDICIPTGAGELSVPAIWPRGKQSQGYLQAPARPQQGGPERSPIGRPVV